MRRTVIEQAEKALASGLPEAAFLLAMVGMRSSRSGTRLQGFTVYPRQAYLLQPHVLDQAVYQGVISQGPVQQAHLACGRIPANVIVHGFSVVRLQRQEGRAAHQERIVSMMRSASPPRGVTSSPMQTPYGIVDGDGHVTESEDQIRPYMDWSPTDRAAGRYARAHSY